MNENNSGAEIIPIHPEMDSDQQQNTTEESRELTSANAFQNPDFLDFWELNRDIVEFIVQRIGKILNKNHYHYFGTIDVVHRSGSRKNVLTTELIVHRQSTVFSVMKTLFDKSNGNHKSIEEAHNEMNSIESESS